MIVDMDCPGGLVPLDQGETLTMLPQPERAVCDYCTSFSLMDMRGNCCCCGAPRHPDYYRPMFLLKHNAPPEVESIRGTYGEWLNRQ